MARLLAPIFALAALGLDLSGAHPGGPGVSLAVAALLAAPQTRGVLSALLGLLALGVALQEGQHALLTPLLWVAHLALGVAIGALARHLEGALLWGLKSHPTQLVTGVVALAAFVLLLPNGLVHFLDASGAPLLLSLTLSEPEFTTQLPVLLPARLFSEAPLSELSGWALLWAPCTAVIVIGASLVESDKARSLAKVALLILSAGLIIPALADLTQLASGGAIPLPSAEELVVALGWTSGGEAGITLHNPPSEAYLGLASRPITSVLHLIVGVALFGLALVAKLEAKEAEPLEAPKVSLGWCWLGVGAAMVSWLGFSAFMSPERLDVIAAWGPHPVAYSALAGALIALSSGLGGLFDEGSHRWSTGLQLLALTIWCVGLVAPSAGWLAL